MMRRTRLIRLGLVFAVVLITLLSILPARAGWNGQQLRLYISCSYAPRLASVTVEGYNQDGNYVRWSTAPYSKSTTTYNWWWKGSVWIAYKYEGTNPYTGYPFSYYGTYAYVPEQYDADIYEVALDAGDDCQPYSP